MRVYKEEEKKINVMYPRNTTNLNGQTYWMNSEWISTMIHKSELKAGYPNTFLVDTHTHTHKSTSFLCVDFVCLFGVLKLLCVTPTQANHTLFPLFYACITPERFVIFLGFYTQFNSRPTHIEYYRVQFIHNSKNRNFWKWLRFFYLMLNFPTASEFGCKTFP